MHAVTILHSRMKRLVTRYNAGCVMSKLVDTVLIVVRQRGLTCSVCVILSVKSIKDSAGSSILGLSSAKVLIVMLFSVVLPLLDNNYYDFWSLKLNFNDDKCCYSNPLPEGGFLFFTL